VPKAHLHLPEFVMMRAIHASPQPLQPLTFHCVFHSQNGWEVRCNGVTTVYPGFTCKAKLPKGGEAGQHQVYDLSLSEFVTMWANAPD